MHCLSSRPGARCGGKRGWVGEGLGSAGASWAEKKLRYNQSSFTVVRILRTDLGLIDKSSGLPAAVRSEVCAKGGTQGGAALGAWLSMWAEEMRSSLQQSKKHQKDPFGCVCNHSGVIKTNRVICFLTCRITGKGREEGARTGQGLWRRRLATSLLKVPCNVRRERGPSLVMLEGREGHPL